MRIYTQLKMRRFVSDSDDAIKEVRISTHDAREHVTSLVASSSWAPEDSLLKHEFEAILKLKPRGEHAGPAAADKARHLTGEHHPRPVGGRTRRAFGLLGPDRGGQGIGATPGSVGRRLSAKRGDRGQEDGVVDVDGPRPGAAATGIGEDLLLGAGLVALDSGRDEGTDHDKAGVAP